MEALLTVLMWLAALTYFFVIYGIWIIGTTAGVVLVLKRPRTAFKNLYGSLISITCIVIFVIIVGNLKGWISP